MSACYLRACPRPSRSCTIPAPFLGTAPDPVAPDWLPSLCSAASSDAFSEANGNAQSLATAWTRARGFGNSASEPTKDVQLMWCGFVKRGEAAWDSTPSCRAGPPRPSQRLNLPPNLRSCRPEVERSQRRRGPGDRHRPGLVRRLRLCHHRRGQGLGHQRGGPGSGQQRGYRQRVQHGPHRHPGLQQPPRQRRRNRDQPEGRQMVRAAAGGLAGLQPARRSACSLPGCA